MFHLIFTSYKTLIELVDSYFPRCEARIFYGVAIAKVGAIHELPLLLSLDYSIILAPFPRLQSKHRLCKLSI